MDDAKEYDRIILSSKDYLKIKLALARGNRSVTEFKDETGPFYIPVNIPHKTNVIKFSEDEDLDDDHIRVLEKGENW